MVGLRELVPAAIPWALGTKDSYVSPFEGPVRVFTSALCFLYMRVHVHICLCLCRWVCLEGVGACVYIYVYVCACVLVGLGGGRELGDGLRSGLELYAGSGV